MVPDQRNAFNISIRWCVRCWEVGQDMLFSQGAAIGLVLCVLAPKAFWHWILWSQQLRSAWMFSYRWICGLLSALHKMLNGSDLFLAISCKCFNQKCIHPQDVNSPSLFSLRKYSPFVLFFPYLSVSHDLFQSWPILPLQSNWFQISWSQPVFFFASTK